MVDKELIVWAAGFFDGDGSALIEVTGKNSFSVVVSVINVVKEGIDVFHEYWGGRLVSRSKVYKDGATRKQVHELYFNHAEARQLLVDIYPYLVVRRRSANVVLRALCQLPKQKEGTTGRLRMPRGSSKVLGAFYDQLRVIRSNS